MAELQRSRL